MIGTVDIDRPGGASPHMNELTAFRGVYQTQGGMSRVIGVSAGQRGVGEHVPCGTNGSMQLLLAESGHTQVTYWTPTPFSFPPEWTLAEADLLYCCFAGLWTRLLAFSTLLTHEAHAHTHPTTSERLQSSFPCGSGTLSITCLV